MTVRIVLGASWALAVGLAGGWLMLSPWALGEQASGRDWTSVTQTEFFTGLGLVVLAVVGLGLVATQALQSLRQAAVIGRRSAPAGSRPDALDGARARGPEATSEEFESALVGLAQALTRELQAPPAGGSEKAAGSDEPYATRRREV
ncbi:hypothetical protein [Candidatus Nephthysia bennettiae]|uniref:Uncharacterized protein n=1 Tax=Candidatus Nephthysia bennettiae TaxID=3127016 RepID=A0A934K7G2_9BACT|nr:hypothetical protein [Candidatus Dormibacteraeota bacterium]MBJ7614294.1 hypothetical protein [Candidatus Dormibacteraeota bacterium]